ncbi:unnamed protein product, partial [Ilex paraguariensis]
MRDFLLLFNCYVVPGKGTSDLTHCIHSGRGGTKSLDKRKGGKWRILPILKRSLYQSHTIDKCWTRPQSNVATSSTPPPLEDHGSHRVAGCCTSFYFAVLSESGPITLEILKQLMSAITQKIEDLGLLLILQTWQIRYMDLLLLLPFPVIGFVDSGATSHMSGDIFLFLSLSPLPIKDSVNIADGTLLTLSHCGSMSSSRILHDIFSFSPLRTNLLSDKEWDPPSPETYTTHSARLLPLSRIKRLRSELRWRIRVKVFDFMLLKIGIKRDVCSYSAADMGCPKERIDTWWSLAGPGHATGQGSSNLSSSDRARLFSLLIR